jgi:hypothetical protein
MPSQPLRMIAELAEKIQRINQETARLHAERWDAKQSLPALISAARGSLSDADLYQILYWMLAGDPSGVLMKLEEIRTLLGFDAWNRAPSPEPLQTTEACPECGSRIWVRNRTELQHLAERGPSSAQCSNCGDQRARQAPFTTSQISSPPRSW